MCLLAAGVCDMFDGAVASTMERTANERRFGIQIDSLSDLVCFGAMTPYFYTALSGRAVSVSSSRGRISCAR